MVAAIPSVLQYGGEACCTMDDFAIYLLKHFEYDLKVAVIACGTMLYLLAGVWLLLWLFLRRRVKRLQALRLIHQELAELFEVRMHGKKFGLRYPAEKAELVRQLQAKGYPMDRVDIDTVLHQSISDRSLRESGWLDEPSPWFVALNNVITRGLNFFLVLVGTFLIIDFWRMGHHPEGGWIICGGCVFLVFSFISAGRQGLLAAMCFTLIISHLSIGLFKPMLARSMNDMREGFRRGMMQEQYRTPEERAARPIADNLGSSAVAE